MKVVVHDYAGHPFQIDLSRQLARNGFDVTHIYTSSSGGPKGGFNSVENLRIIDLQLDKIDKANLFKRRGQEINYGKELIKQLKSINPNVVISANTPLDAQKQLLRFCKNNDISFIFWLQDIISVAMDSILKRKLGFIGSMISWYYKLVERSVLKDSDHVVVIAEDFKNVIIPWGVENSKITTIPNWAPIEEMPVYPKSNPFSKAHGIEDKFVVLYSGTMGMKHNPSIISEAAKKLQNEPDIVFVVISEGQGMKYLKKAKSNLQLENLRLLPFQPFEELPKVLGSADCLVTLLEPKAGIFSVPSKVWSAYCAKRPSLLVMPAQNLAARITENINAGFIIDNENPVNQLCEKIIQLKKNDELRDLLGNNARQYAEEHFYVEKIAKKFANILNII